MTNLLRLTDGDCAMRSFLAVVVARQNCFSVVEIGFVLRKMTKQPHLSVKSPREAQEASCCAFGAAVAQWGGPARSRASARLRGSKTDPCRRAV